jgi:hypothetical protein
MVSRRLEPRIMYAPTCVCLSRGYVIDSAGEFAACDCAAGIEWAKQYGLVTLGRETHEAAAINSQYNGLALVVWFDDYAPAADEIPTLYEVRLTPEQVNPLGLRELWHRLSEELRCKLEGRGCSREVLADTLESKLQASRAGSEPGPGYLRWPLHPVEPGADHRSISGDKACSFAGK